MPDNIGPGPSRYRICTRPLGPRFPHPPSLARQGRCTCILDCRRHPPFRPVICHASRCLVRPLCKHAQTPPSSCCQRQITPTICFDATPPGTRRAIMHTCVRARLLESWSGMRLPHPHPAESLSLSHEYHLVPLLTSSFGHVVLMQLASRSRFRQCFDRKWPANTLLEGPSKGSHVSFRPALSAGFRCPRVQTAVRTMSTRH